MPFVIDASVVLSWHFKDEIWPAADPIAELAIRDGLIVPSYFFIELGNGLLRGERMERTTRQATEGFLRRLDSFDVEQDSSPEADAVTNVLPIARAHGLKLFDAGYLYLAMIRELSLATFDKALAAAARATGVPLLEH